ncbi:fructokinase [Rhizomicrobium palustre]|uniref:fructokinase n=1 Tax=Rhizomicrobium palustre TaxID=189966 RepID=A0A846MTS9_9PROT|nr:ROK family protein [Rhizomicrobium palustre]NIK86766.1 fructokinase [Rhizomicrobium palustre]
MAANRFGAIEAGGTKFVCAVGSSPNDLSAVERIPTTTPAETMARVRAYFEAQIAQGGPLQAIGIATFGPAGVHPGAPEWGTILSTPKPGWSNTSLVQPLGDAFGVPVGFDTDVNGAALAEHRWGAGAGANVSTYVTIGTGVGGGTVANGRIIHGLRHPEVGHFYPRRHGEDVQFSGICPFHGDCLEGLASGPAIATRWGTSLSQLPSNHIAHEVIAYYLGQMVVNLQAVLAPRRIILGGGVSQTPGLLEEVARAAKRLGNGYFAPAKDMERLISAPELGERSGILGAVLLAEQALQKQAKNT